MKSKKKTAKKGISKKGQLKNKLDLNFKTRKCLLDKTEIKQKRLQKSPIKLDYESHNCKQDANEDVSLWGNSLPYEILFKIFKLFSFTIKGDVRRLNSLKLVCRQWCLVASDMRLWHHLDLSMFSFRTSVKRILNSRIKLDYLVKLNLNHMKEFTCDHLNQILSNCNPLVLKELNLAHCEKIQVSKSNINFLKVIGEKCPSLNSLDLSGMKKTLKQTDMQYIFSTLNLNLKQLIIAQNYITPLLLYSLARYCSNLELIDISNCDPLSPILKSKFNLDVLMNSCPKIKCFRMLNCSIQTNYDSIHRVLASEEHFVKLTEFSSGLGFQHPFYTEHLSTNFLLFMMAKVCKDALNLKLLDLRAYKSPLNSQLNLFDIIKSNVLEKLYLCNSNLSEADCFYLSQAISKKWCTSLVVLDLSWCNITKEYLMKIFETFILNANKVQLRSLTLIGTCVDTKMIKELLDSLKHLEHIDLSSCRSVERGMKKNNSVEELKQFFKTFSF